MGMIGLGSRKITHFYLWPTATLLQIGRGHKKRQTS